MKTLFYHTRWGLGLIACMYLVLLGGCQKSDNVLMYDSFEQAILGKWEIISANNQPYESAEFVEYLPDSVVKHVSYDRMIPDTEEKYWIKDTVLYRGVIEDNMFHGVKFKYEFSKDYNELKLIYIDVLPMINSFTYRRID